LCHLSPVTCWSCCCQWNYSSGGLRSCCWPGLSFPGEEQAEQATAVLGSSGSSSQAATPPSVIAWKGEEDNESLRSSQNLGRNKQTDQEGGREGGRRS
jgi:hypothetical protein